jgi:hypothetical protein
MEEMREMPVEITVQRQITEYLTITSFLHHADTALFTAPTTLATQTTHQHGIAIPSASPNHIKEATAPVTFRPKYPMVALSEDMVPEKWKPDPLGPVHERWYTALEITGGLLAMGILGVWVWGCCW